MFKRNTRLILNNNAIMATIILSHLHHLSDSTSQVYYNSSMSKILLDEI